MSVYHVPKPEWATFFDRLNGMEEGELVNIDVFTEPHTERADRVASLRPLSTLALGSDERFCVSVTHPPEVIELVKPVSLRFEQPSTFGRAALIVDGESGEHVIIGFERPVVPGVMDELP